ncbi:LytR/AlgR family response regulator transcription factor [Pelotomaculum propionicicum]|uniref:Stage 0 sporulation protein A homolog n=1 Tax=Pelotomaculum propionicicum TaxID=258475 RepID=A0A4Y7RP57_9FIRM|nr:LytTR family transcriptional regulator DNA-binding domain-containing protein [Pelotomaculum propionicicum]NLI13253.1 response regulator [Peptococcaceae bacterium]TEB10519.1 Transcriptional regulatory protein YpdB [Pelotomaculum propionicicum]
MKLKALIIDDEYPARQELRYALGNFDNIEIVGEATNAMEALALIKALDYQVLFLDISMPGMNGLELGAAIQELPNRPYIIFVTAFDEFALSAFDVNAIDYILKPIEPKRLKKAIDKVTKLTRESKAVSEELLHSPEGPAARNGGLKSEHKDKELIKIDRIPAEIQGKTILVSESDIFYAYTEQDNIYLKTFNEKLFTRFTLKELESRLNPQVFFRTHRCYLVNLNKVKEIVPFFNGTYNLIVEDKERSEVPVSRAQAKKLRRILGF